MFKSYLDSTKIAGDAKKRVSPEAFSNFMTGGASSIGSSVLTSAANNISNFSRGGVNINVKGTSDLTSIIDNISTNIVNNVDNSISNTLNSFRTEIQNVIGGLQKQAQSNLSSVIEGFTKDYQKKVQTKEDTEPSNILKGFLSLYKNAIDFVTFFGDSRNNKRIESNLKSLRSLFDESLDAAIVIRQVINKIVKQLSNLPTASPTSGSLNLDIKVPGGPLKQSGAKSIGGVFAGGRGKALAIGAAGVAGVGLLGMQSAKAKQEEKLAATAKKPVGPESESNSFMDGLNNIIERFSKAIESLLGGGKDKSGSSGASSSAPSSSPDGASGAPPGGSPEVTTTGEKGVLDLIASVEQGPEGYDSFNQSTGKTSGKATEKTIGWLAQNAKGAIGRYQHMPAYILERAKAAGYNENTLFTPEVQDAITIKQLKTEHNLDAFLSGSMSSEDFLTKLSPTWRGLPQGVFNARKMGGTPDSTYNDSSAGGGRNAAHKTLAETLKILNRIQGGVNPQIETVTPNPSNTTPQATTQPSTPQTPKVEPAQPPQKVSNVFTPPGSSGASQVAFASLPPNITVIPGEGGSNSGGVIPTPLSGGESATPDVSMYIGTGNPDNPHWATTIPLGILNA